MTKKYTKGLFAALVLTLGVVLTLTFATADDKKAETTAAPTPAAATTSAQAPLSAGDKLGMDAIIHDYIMNNPEVIMQSMVEYQKRTVEKRQKDALTVYRSDIFNDAASPVAGNPKGDVTVVEFFDYNCGYCKMSATPLLKLLDEDKNIRLVFKDLPVLGPTSETAAKWSLAADLQGKYLAFYTVMMQNKKPITDELLAEKAKEAGLDIEKAKIDVESESITTQLQNIRSLAGQMGLTGTPVFVIGEDIHFGALTLDQMKEKIKAARDAKTAPKAK